MLNKILNKSSVKTQKMQYNNITQNINTLFFIYIVYLQIYGFRDLLYKLIKHREYLNLNVQL